MASQIAKTLSFIAIGILVTSGAGRITAAAVPYMLSTNETTFFCADTGMEAFYYRFNRDGTYVLIAKAHLGVFPCEEGSWIQASNGVVTMSPGLLPVRPPEKKVTPMTYKNKVFLVWAERFGTRSAEGMCRAIDAGTNAPKVCNEFMISNEAFTRGTAKPYPFKYHKEMNEVTGAAEEGGLNP